MWRWIAGWALFVGVSAPALALDTGQCLPAAQVRAELAAQGMQPIIVGDRSGYGYQTSLIFFADEGGSRGYLIRGDRPFGQPSETVCVESVFRDLHIGDIARPGIPEWARLPVRPREVEVLCRGHLGYQDDCRRHDESLANLDRSGQRVMLVATGTAINPRDKSIRIGQRLIVTIDPSRAGGLINAVTPEGANYMLAAYVRASYTQFGSALLDKAAKP